MRARLNIETRVICLAAAFSACIAVGLMLVASPAHTVPQTALDKSAVLVTARVLDPANPAQEHYTAGPTMEERARTLLSSVLPLPPGATFESFAIDWTSMPPVSEDDLAFMLQFDAACAWYESVLTDGLGETGRHVVSDIPRWSGFRGQDQMSASLRDLAANAMRGSLDPVRDFVRLNCQSVRLL